MRGGGAIVNIGSNVSTRAIHKRGAYVASKGGIDHFVANVSALGTENTPKGWRKAIEVDLVATVNAVLCVRPHLEARGKGATLTIIGTTSLVEIAGPTQPYRSVKAALVPMVKSIAIEVAPKGVRVNMVSPGTILEDGNTWGRQRDAGAERYKRMLARNPMGRMGTPQEVAAAVVFLAGTPASFISGVNFIVDGALTSRVQY